MIQALASHVTEKILPFWEKLIDREHGGFYGFVDERPHGEWHAYARADGTLLDRPVVDEWKCPYHDGRMCLRLIEKAKG